MFSGMHAPSPEGAQHESPARKCWETVRRSIQVPKGRHSAENIFGIIRNARLLQHGNEFLLKCALSVMLRLVRYIGFKRAHVGRADAERAIALLPSKFDSVLADPARRICFEYLDSDAEGNC